MDALNQTIGNITSNTFNAFNIVSVVPITLAGVIILAIVSLLSYREIKHDFKNIKRIINGLIIIFMAVMASTIPVIFLGLSYRVGETALSIPKEYYIAFITFIGGLWIVGKVGEKNNLNMMSEERK